MRKIDNTNIKDSIIVDNKHIFAGDIKIGKSCNFSFIMKNNTLDTLSVDTITTSCECINIIKSFSYIYPENTDSILISFSSNDKGYITRGLTLIFKEIKEPITLTIEGTMIE